MRRAAKKPPAVDAGWRSIDEATNEKRETTDPVKRRLFGLVEALGTGLVEYEKSNPNWFAETAFELITHGLRSLQHCLENRRDKEVTWDNPIVEFHYPVAWGWRAWRAERRASIRMVFGELTPQSTRTRRQAVRALARIAWQTRNVFVLGELTKHAGWHKHRNRSRIFVPEHIASPLRRLSRAQQRRALEELYRPFTIGAVELDLAPSPSVAEFDGSHVSRAIKRDGKSIDVSALTISGERDGERFSLSLVVQFHPFVIDEDNHKAYYPIVVGLFFHPTSAQIVSIHNGTPELVITSPDPRAWPRRDRNQFWQTLLRAWTTPAKTRKTTPIASAPNRAVELSVKARVIPFDERKRSDMLRNAIKAIEKDGKVESISYDMNSVDLEPLENSRRLEHKIASAQFDVFLAYNSKDRLFVARIANLLKSRAIYPWWDDDVVLPGRRFQQLFQRDARRIRTVAVFIGPHGVGP